MASTPASPGFRSTSITSSGGPAPRRAPTVGGVASKASATVTPEACRNSSGTVAVFPAPPPRRRLRRGARVIFQSLASRDFAIGFPLRRP